MFVLAGDTSMDNSMSQSESKWEKFKKTVSANGDSKPWHILNSGLHVTEEKVIEQRLNICFDCDRLIKATSQCKECGCFMKLKTRLQHAKCPLAKW